ncbi:hypothetical protein BESB_047730 [Besnoitia besnoiti]|uniref:Transmembrane protein n=1 Tax=Besnoitia besnoiti TaxID=94643 RepID=A0A2A9MJZ7_BESBE|nr:hypothetical protein BESB_047730 [Besnoitia besnoiti]PFH36581.1 hypothetical protein BESB_047730 [Besnoitia besnoiti]
MRAPPLFHSYSTYCIASQAPLLSGYGNSEEKAERRQRQLLFSACALTQAVQTPRSDDSSPRDSTLSSSPPDDVTVVLDSGDASGSPLTFTYSHAEPFAFPSASRSPSPLCCANAASTGKSQSPTRSPQSELSRSPSFASSPCQSVACGNTDEESFFQSLRSSCLFESGDPPSYRVKTEPGVVSAQRGRERLATRSRPPRLANSTLPFWSSGQSQEAGCMCGPSSVSSQDEVPCSSAASCARCSSGCRYNGEASEAQLCSADGGEHTCVPRSGFSSARVPFSPCSDVRLFASSRTSTGFFTLPSLIQPPESRRRRRRAAFLSLLAFLFCVFLFFGVLLPMSRASQLGNMLMADHIKATGSKRSLGTVPAGLTEETPTSLLPLPECSTKRRGDSSDAPTGLDGGEGPWLAKILHFVETIFSSNSASLSSTVPAEWQPTLLSLIVHSSALLRSAFPVLSSLPAVFLFLLLVSVCCCLLCIAISFTLVCKHLMNYYEPSLQRYVCRICLVSPTFAIASLIYFAHTLSSAAPPSDSRSSLSSYTVGASASPAAVATSVTPASRLAPQSEASSQGLEEYLDDSSSLGDSARVPDAGLFATTAASEARVEEIFIDFLRDLGQAGALYSFLVLMINCCGNDRCISMTLACNPKLVNAVPPLNFFIPSFHPKPHILRYLKVGVMQFVLVVPLVGVISLLQAIYDSDSMPLLAHSTSALQEAPLVASSLMDSGGTTPGDKTFSDDVGDHSPPSVNVSPQASPSADFPALRIDSRDIGALLSFFPVFLSLPTVLMYRASDWFLFRGMAAATSLVLLGSVFICMLSLLQFYLCTESLIRPYKPLQKFLSIKVLVFFQVWQRLAIRTLLGVGVIQGNTVFEAEQMADLYHNILMSVWMVFISISHVLCFPVSDHLPEVVGGARGACFVEPPSASFCQGLLEVLLAVDVLQDAREIALLPHRSLDRACSILHEQCLKADSEFHHLLSLDGRSELDRLLSSSCLRTHSQATVAFEAQVAPDDRSPASATTLLPWIRRATASAPSGLFRGLFGSMETGSDARADTHDARDSQERSRRKDDERSRHKFSVRSRSDSDVVVPTLKALSGSSDRRRIPLLSSASASELRLPSDFCPTGLAGEAKPREVEHRFLPLREELDDGRTSQPELVCPPAPTSSPVAGISSPEVYLPPLSRCLTSLSQTLSSSGEGVSAGTVRESLPACAHFLLSPRNASSAHSGSVASPQAHSSARSESQFGGGDPFAHANLFSPSSRGASFALAAGPSSHHGAASLRGPAPLPPYASPLASVAASIAVSGRYPRSATGRAAVAARFLLASSPTSPFHRCPAAALAVALGAQLPVPAFGFEEIPEATTRGSSRDTLVSRTLSHPPPGVHQGFAVSLPAHAPRTTFAVDERDLAVVEAEARHAGSTVCAHRLSHTYDHLPDLPEQKMAELDAAVGHEEAPSAGGGRGPLALGANDTEAKGARGGERASENSRDEGESWNGSFRHRSLASALTTAGVDCSASPSSCLLEGERQSPLACLKDEGGLRSPDGASARARPGRHFAAEAGEREALPAASRDAQVSRGPEPPIGCCEANTRRLKSWISQPEPPADVHLFLASAAYERRHEQTETRGASEGNCRRPRKGARDLGDLQRAPLPTKGQRRRLGFGGGGPESGAALRGLRRRSLPSASVKGEEDAETELWTEAAEEDAYPRLLQPGVLQQAEENEEDGVRWRAPAPAAETAACKKESPGDFPWLSEDCACEGRNAPRADTESRNPRRKQPDQPFGDRGDGGPEASPCSPQSLGGDGSEEERPGESAGASAQAHSRSACLLQVETETGARRFTGAPELSAQDEHDAGNFTDSAGQGAPPAYPTRMATEEAPEAERHGSSCGEGEQGCNLTTSELACGLRVASESAQERSCREAEGDGEETPPFERMDEERETEEIWPEDESVRIVQSPLRLGWSCEVVEEEDEEDASSFYSRNQMF